MNDICTETADAGTPAAGQSLALIGLCFTLRPLLPYK
jgi:hypothetical protein